MKNKHTRLSTIKRIISEELISSQEELIKRLSDYGIQSTQSTLSRDFKEINISKIPHPERGYIYVLSEQLTSDMVVGPANLCDAVLGIRFSQNIAVITTKPGYASAISVTIDGHKTKDILGTIAGDNCIMVILHEDSQREEVIAYMNSLFPVLKHLG